LAVRLDFVSAAELTHFLGLKPRSASLLAAKWVTEGFFALVNSSRKARRYRLASRYLAMVQPACEQSSLPSSRLRRGSPDLSQ
jgi:hypothetical protein